MRSLPSTLGPLFLFPLLAAAACAGDNFAPDVAAGGAGASGPTSGGGNGAGANASGGRVGEGGAGNASAGGSGGSGTAGDQAAGGTDVGQGGTETGAGGDEASAGEGGSSGDAGAGGSDATGGVGGSAGNGSAGKAGTGGKAGSTGTAGAAGKAGAAGSANAGAGGSAGGAGASGSAGVAGSAGSSGIGGSAGAGGAPPVSCGGELGECSDGSYCDQQDQICRPCGDLERLRFGTAVARITPGSGVGGQNRSEVAFPRPALRDGQRVLFFRATQSDTDDIAAVLLNAQSVPTSNTNVQCCVNKPADDSGFLLLPAGLDGTTFGAVSNHAAISGGNFPFAIIDSKRGFSLGQQNAGSNADGTRRRIHIAQVDPSGVANGYGPIPLLNQGLDDYSVALSTAAAPGARRFYWMSRRGSPELTGLRTLLLPASVSPPAGLPAQPPADLSQPVTVRIPGCSGDPEVNDFRPWITPEGTRLIFNARCASGDDSKLFVVTPNVDGTLPVATRLEIASTNDNDVDEGGSLSPNKCELWFVRNGAIHSARRR